MKRLIIGASALLLSGSALAAVPSNTDYHYAPASALGSYAWNASPMLTDAAWDSAMTYAEAANWTADKPTELSADQKAEKEAWLAANSMNVSADMAATSPVDKPVELTAAHIAEKDAWVAANSMEMASAKPWSGTTWRDKPADTAATGQGGPFESAEAERTSWPACDPGPGDDRCIQLYEPGVRAAYASWQSGRERMAMGGPEEPVESASASTTTAYNGDGVLTAEEMQDRPVYSESTTTGQVYTGVGGPLEEIRHYPPCRSRSDDRCQQGN